MLHWYPKLIHEHYSNESTCRFKLHLNKQNQIYFFITPNSRRARLQRIEPCEVLDPQHIWSW